MENNVTKTTTDTEKGDAGALLQGLGWTMLTDTSKFCTTICERKELYRRRVLQTAHWQTQPALSLVRPGKQQYPVTLFNDW